MNDPLPEEKREYWCCSKKGCWEVGEKNMELHHLIPKFAGGTDLDGRTPICKKHHDILHHRMLGVLWHMMFRQERPNVDEARQELKNYTLSWLDASKN